MGVANPNETDAERKRRLARKAQAAEDVVRLRDELARARAGQGRPVTPPTSAPSGKVRVRASADDRAEAKLRLTEELQTLREELRQAQVDVAASAADHRAHYEAQRQARVTTNLTPPPTPAEVRSARMRGTPIEPDVSNTVALKLEIARLKAIKERHHERVAQLHAEAAQAGARKEQEQARQRGKNKRVKQTIAVRRAAAKQSYVASLGEGKGKHAIVRTPPKQGPGFVLALPSGAFKVETFGDQEPKVYASLRDAEEELRLRFAREVTKEQGRRSKAGEQPLSDAEIRQMRIDHRAKHQIYLADDPAVIGQQTPILFERPDEALAEGKLDALDMADSGGGFESNRRRH